MKSSKQAGANLPLAGTDRLKNLSDGIFAFAMTLLILGVDIPRLPREISDADLLRQLVSQWREVAVYIISFLNIGSYWMLHQGLFAYLSHTNRTLTQLNLLFLLTVTFLPYPTALQGEFGKQPAIALVYGFTIVANYALLFTLAWYAYGKSELVDPHFHLTLNKKSLILRFIPPLLLAVGGSILAFFFVRLGFLFFTLVPLSSVIPTNWLVLSEDDEPNSR